MSTVAGEYFVQLASGITVLVVGVAAAGARRWAKGLSERLDQLDRDSEHRIGRVHERIDAVVDSQVENRERIVRVETALLLTPPGPRTSERALDAILSGPAPHGVPEDTGGPVEG